MVGGNAVSKVLDCISMHIAACWNPMTITMVGDNAVSIMLDSLSMHVVKAAKLDELNSRCLQSFMICNGCSSSAAHFASREKLIDAA